MLKDELSFTSWIKKAASDTGDWFKGAGTTISNTASSIFKKSKDKHEENKLASVLAASNVTTSCWEYTNGKCTTKTIC